MSTMLSTTSMDSSPFGTYRPVTIILLLGAFFIFSLSVIFDLPWELGWFCIAIVLLSEIFQSLYDLRRRYFMFDGLLFSASNLLFIVADPVFAIVVGQDFPRVFDTFYSGNEVGNFSGLLVTTYFLSFFLGRLFIRSNRTRFRNDRRVLRRPHATKLHVLALAVAISVSAFLANGGGFNIGNLLNTIVARSSGYVAFASAGLGTQNPVIVLMA